MLEFVDKRLRPLVEDASREVSEAKWRRSDEGYRRAKRNYDRRLEDWLYQRSKIMTPEIFEASTCPRTLAITIRHPVIPAPREVSARTREIAHEPTPGSCRCLRCGAPAEDGLVHPGATICERCFGQL